MKNNSEVFETLLMEQLPNNQYRIYWVKDQVEEVPVVLCYHRQY